MAMQDLASALKRAENVFARRPESGLHDDAPATARWAGGTRVVASHASGTQVSTDMPAELGGSGDQVAPGWLLRAGTASCAATCIAIHAASEGIALSMLEVVAGSRSDTRGLLGMTEADGTPVPPGPQAMQLTVRIAAAGVAPERLRALVETAHRCAPVSSALRAPVPVRLQVQVDDAG